MAREAIRSSHAINGTPRHSNLPIPARASRKTSDCQILGLVAVAEAADNVGIDTMEISLIQLVEARGIALCGFHSQSIVYVRTHSVFVRVIHRKGQKVTAGRLRAGRRKSAAVYAPILCRLANLFLDLLGVERGYANRHSGFTGDVEDRVQTRSDGHSQVGAGRQDAREFAGGTSPGDRPRAQAATPTRRAGSERDYSGRSREYRVF